MTNLSTNAIKFTQADKTALSQAKKDYEVAQKEAKKQAAEELTLMLLGNSDATTQKGVRRDVKNDLKEMYESGEIDKDVYKAAKKYSTKGTWWNRLMGKKKDSTIAFQRQATNNNINNIIANGGPKFSAEITGKLEKAGFKAEDLYEMFEDNNKGLGAEYTLSYSYKKKQPGEADALKGLLNSNEAGVEFSKKEVKEIAKSLGYNVEKAVSAGKIARDTLVPAVAATPLAFVEISSKAASSTTSAVADSAAEFSLGGFAPAVAGVTGASVSAYNQATRVEKKVAEEEIPEHIKTYDQYAQYIEDYSTEKGATLMKKIAKFYVEDDKTTLNVAEMEAQLKKAAGGGSVLNYEEALALYTDLIQTEPEIDDVIVEDVEEDKCQITNTQNKQSVEVALPTENYTIKSGDNWYEVVVGKYKPKNSKDAQALVRFLKDTAYADMKANGTLPASVKSSKDAFFGKVGDTLKLPTEIEVNGTVYSYIKEGNVKAGDINGNAAIYKQQANPFTVQSETTTYGYDTSCGESVTGLTEEERNKKVQELVVAGTHELVQ